MYILICLKIVNIIQIIHRQASTISGEHCRITYRKHSRTYYIEDLHSLNGTYLGAKRLEPNTPEKLLDNAEISIGRIRFCFVRQK